MAPLPPREQRHPFLRYQGLEYTNADIADFEQRLERIYSQEIHWVQVVDFQRMPELMRDGEAKRHLSWRQFILALGLHTGEEMESLGFARDISTDGDFLGSPPSYTLIRDPVLRLYHQMMAHSVAGRIQALEKVTVTDLFYLKGLDVRSFVARLAEHFGLLTAEILGGLIVTTPELLIIDMAELVRLQICEQLDDTWAWVAMGPERHPDAVAGAPRFCTWTTTSLARMMDREGVTYTSYSETPREYTSNYRVIGESQQKARILELKWRYFEDYYSEDQYAVSIKEDTVYSCLHSPRPQKDKDQYAVSRETQYAVFKI
ncbi:hypothetical protein Tco_1032046 [Tanacetum coccineum]|uniref:Uncharacterized protein n=1 Tax=Tanacetum coccineum TaxID=301880 RepID=A0ABQ5GB95_9ASTR